MNIVATRKTAAVAGAWAAFGLVSFDGWMSLHAPSATIGQNAVWLLAFAVFLFVPVYFLVLGRDTEPFSRTWFLDPDERARYVLVIHRMLVWSLCAGVVAILWTSVLGWFLGGTSQ